MVVERRQHTACVGQTITLPCRPHVEKDVDWNYWATATSSHYRVYSNGLIYRRFNESISRGRFAVVKSVGGDYNLVISNVSTSDAGRYTCVEDMGSGAEHVAELNVTGKLYLLNFVMYTVGQKKTRQFSFCISSWIFRPTPPSPI